MLSLREFTDEFIQTKLQSFEGDDRTDEAVIQAIGKQNMDHTDREDHILRWLNKYRVLLFFPPEKSREIAGQIIEFADERSQAPLNQNKDLILKEYERLRGRISRVAPLSPKSGKPREIISLTSKALWCCYPHEIPIFDAYAERALQVISRLSRMMPSQSQPEYACFIDVWFQVYQEVKPVIDQSNLNGYPYKIRVLDRLLWHLGQPSFESQRDTPPKLEGR